MPPAAGVAAAAKSPSRFNAMPRKDRPAPLSDSIFQAKLEQHQHPGDVAPVPEEIPVHNTFIQFGAQESPGIGKKHLSTAPAWVGGPMIEAAMQAAVASSMQVPEQPQGHGVLIHGAGEPTKLASPKKVPVMRYSLSASSARAAGYTGSSAVITSYEPDGNFEAGGWTDGGTSPRTGPAQWGDEDDEDDDGEDDDEAESGEEPPLRRAPRGPLAPPGPLPSRGSSKHNDGLCKRCCFFPKGRCNNGFDCEFCHFEHEKRKRKKKKKGSKVKDSDSDGAARAPPAPSGSSTAAPAATTVQAPAPQVKTPPASETGPPSSTEATFQSYDAATAGGVWGPSSTIEQPLLRGPPSGLPLTAPPPLPPRGLPLPGEQPQLAAYPGHEHLLGHPAYDPYYTSRSYSAAMPLPIGAGAVDAYGMPLYSRALNYAAAGLQPAGGTGLAASLGYGAGPGGVTLPPPR